MSDNHFVVVGPRCYGSSKKSAEAALQSAFCSAPTQYKRIQDLPYNLYRASDDWEVDAFGVIRATKLTKLREYRPVKG